MSIYPLPAPAATSTRVRPAAQVRNAEPSRIYAQSIVIMTLLFTFGIAIPTWIAMDDAAFAFGLGLFSAFWGGPGFGVMAGAARIAMQIDRLDADH